MKILVIYFCWIKTLLIYIKYFIVKYSQLIENFHATYPGLLLQTFIFPPPARVQLELFFKHLLIVYVRGRHRFAVYGHVIFSVSQWGRGVEQEAGVVGVLVDLKMVAAGFQVVFIVVAYFVGRNSSQSGIVSCKRYKLNLLKTWIILGARQFKFLVIMSFIFLFFNFS